MELSEPRKSNIYGGGVILVEEDTPPAQEVAAVANNLDTPLRIVAVQLVENLVVCP